MAVQQGGAQRIFQIGQPLADGRCGNELPLGRAPDAAQLAHGHEELQRGEVDLAGEVAFGEHGHLTSRLERSECDFPSDGVAMASPKAMAGLLLRAGQSRKKARRAAGFSGRGRRSAAGQRLDVARTEPVNSWRGRPILYSGSPIISLSWAIQPTVRASAKMPVNSGTGMPMARCTMPE
jgi:hypothetical protein